MFRNDSNDKENMMLLSLNTKALVFLTMVASVQIVIGSLANLIVIFVIYMAKELRNRSEDRLLFNLAIADFFALTTFLTWHTYLLSKGRISENQRIYEALNTLAVFYCGNSVLAVAVDRFIAIVLPFRHRVIMANRTTLLMAFLAFSLAVTLAVIEVLKLLEYIEALFISFNVIQLLTMVLLYSTIFCCGVKQSRAILKQRQNIVGDYGSYSGRFLSKILQNTFVLVFLFCVTYLPLLCYSISSLFMGRSRRDQVSARSCIYSFMYLNSSVNPFVYALRTKRFWAAFYSKMFRQGFSLESNSLLSDPRRKQLEAPEASTACSPRTVVHSLQQNNKDFKITTTDYGHG